MDVKKEYERWLCADIEKELHDELAAIKDDVAAMTDRFYCALDFGTAGLRGVMGAGTNRMNIYTVRQASQAFAEYLIESGENLSVAVAYDSRNRSELFAKETARVLCANGIKTYIFKELTPTPVLSYAVRKLGCGGGVVITASHNPAEYNGYKAYGADGGQISPEISKKVCAKTEKTDIFTGAKVADFEKGLESGVIEYVSDALIKEYLEDVCSIALVPGICGECKVRTVYTPLNGTGIGYVPKMLGMIGADDFVIPAEQKEPDGDFPTCPFPNPELRNALDVGLSLCERVGAEMLLATDPDCDRVSVAVRCAEGFKILSGNEIGVLLTDYICKVRKGNGTLPACPVVVKSIVSSPLADKVAEGYGAEMVNVYTGFRFIAETIKELEEKGEEERFILGFEESCGYLSGSFVRDKDGVQGCLLISEMASYWKKRGCTLADRLGEIYEKYGCRFDCQSNLYFSGEEGMEKMKSFMRGFRQKVPEKFGIYNVTGYADYLTGKAVRDGKEKPTGLAPADVLEYTIPVGRVIVRPSGTEPKIKVYYSVSGKSMDEAEKIAAEVKAATESIFG